MLVPRCVINAEMTNYTVSDVFKAWLMMQQFNLFGADNSSKQNNRLARKGGGWSTYNYKQRKKKEKREKRIKDTVHVGHVWDNLKQSKSIEISVEFRRCDCLINVSSSHQYIEYKSLIRKGFVLFCFFSQTRFKITQCRLTAKGKRVKFKMTGVLSLEEISSMFQPGNQLQQFRIIILTMHYATCIVNFWFLKHNSVNTTYQSGQLVWPSENFPNNFYTSNQRN